MGRFLQNDNLSITGTITGEFQYSHTSYGEGFYKSIVSVQRTSGVMDFIPVIVSERLVDVNASWDGHKIMVSGTLRSSDKWEGNKRHLNVYAFADEISLAEYEQPDVNDVYLEGNICRKPIYRKTPYGREISEMILAVDMGSRRNSYIPCICWGRNALYASKMDVGQMVIAEGRIQSREYFKKIDGDVKETRNECEVSDKTLEAFYGNLVKNCEKGLFEKRTVYEVSIYKVEKGETTI